MVSFEMEIENAQMSDLGSYGNTYPTVFPMNGLYSYIGAIFPVLTNHAHPSTPLGVTQPLVC